MGNRLDMVSNLEGVDLNRHDKNNIIKDTPARIGFKVFNYILLAALAIVCLAPLWHILMLSFSNPNMIARTTGMVLWPLAGTDARGGDLPMTAGGYLIVLKNSSLIRGYANTIFYVGAGCFLSIVCAAIGAYCVSRRTLFGAYLIIIMMVSMFFNGGMIPTYMVNKALGLVNTRWVIVLNGMLSVFNILILMMAFNNLPQGLEESAQLDGAGHFTMLFKVALPLVKASIAVIALFYAIGKWNEYITAQIYIRNPKLFPLQIILRQILLDAQTPAGMDTDISAVLGKEGNVQELVKYCTTIVGTVPLLCIYPFIQKYFVKGIMIGSMKG
ncbi:MAG: carbohydrate ABC transporter permease [Oscillospiraceae bacterium]|jgi:putative aldouronate transport system permease protein|nr:carbohydrate ABC transporter permease [Oscillospiraceae bacterium]